MKLQYYAFAIVAALFLGLAPQASAQNLITKPKAEQIADAINQTQSELYNRNIAILKALYRSVNTPGEQQAILDVFGTNAVVAMTNYGIMRAALLSINPEADLPAIDTERFVANEDGTVTYVPVVEPPAE